MVVVPFCTENAARRVSRIDIRCCHEQKLDRLGSENAVETVHGRGRFIRVECKSRDLVSHVGPNQVVEIRDLVLFRLCPPL